MKEYISYEVNISDSEDMIMCASAENYNELVYDTFGYLEKIDDDRMLFFVMTGVTDKGKRITLCNAGKGMGPIAKKNIMNIMVSFDPIMYPENNTIFDGVVSKCGNSYVLKITEQCRQMRLDIGDMVRVKMERINTPDSRDNIQRLFYRKDAEPIDKGHIYVDQPEYLDKFIKDYRIIGEIPLDGIAFDFIMDHAIDHQFAVKNEDGDVILVSQPYRKEGKEEYAKAFADTHGLEYDYINEYSWYHRGETKLIIFWLKGRELRKAGQ